MPRLGFWFVPAPSVVQAVLLYSGTDWQTVSGQAFLPDLPPEVAARMLPEESAAREAGELRTLIACAPLVPGTTSGQLDAYLPVVWAYMLEHDPNG